MTRWKQEPFYFHRNTSGRNTMTDQHTSGPVVNREALRVFPNSRDGKAAVTYFCQYIIDNNSYLNHQLTDNNSRAHNYYYLILFFSLKLRKEKAKLRRRLFTRTAGKLLTWPEKKSDWRRKKGVGIRSNTQVWCRDSRCC